MKISLVEIAKLVKGEIKGVSDKQITGVAPFENAKSDDITFVRNAKFLKKINETNAGAVFVSTVAKSSKNMVIVNNPNLAFAKIVTFFHPHSKPDYFAQHKNAFIGNNFQKGEDVCIAPFAVIGNNVTVGNNVVIHPSVVIENDVEIGNDVEIYPNVTIYERCKIGSRVIIHAGTVIGSDGFGFVPDGQKYYKLPHTGIVQIDDDVEIGACNTIDRATFGKTWIKTGVKTDNLVHIAHNVTVGENTVLVAHVGISGSVNIGKHVILAGQAGVAGHLDIGDNAIIGPQAGVVKSVPKGKTVSGSPEMPHKLWLKVHNILLKLPELKKKILKIEKQLGNNK